MRVISFMRQGSELTPIEIELTLAPGLPIIHFLGLPDAGVRESALRIRSAIRQQGFRFPKAQQVLVQLKPVHLRKSSLGLDLAVAAALLWETKQVKRPSEPSPILYGTLSLAGEVEAPVDIGDVVIAQGQSVITGQVSAMGKSAEDMASEQTLQPWTFASRQIKALAELKEMPDIQPGSALVLGMRPPPRLSHFPSEAAELAKIISVGEHSALLAGPAGTGKTTLADSIIAWLAPPQPDAISTLRRFIHLGPAGSWRPLVKPHHTTTRAAMVGGGSRGWAGEITRAHSGVLLMDELLKFSAPVIEALREPIETGSVSIARGGIAKAYPARFILLATSNLCECGRYVPSADGNGCTCTRRGRARSLDRLSGPFADRFAIVSYTDRWRDQRPNVASADIAKAVERAICFRLEIRGQTHPNSSLSGSAIEAGLSVFQRKQLLSELDGEHVSHRRIESVLRVARTCADLEETESIQNRHLDRALRYAYQGHCQLADWSS